MALTDQIAALATRIATEVKAKVPTSRTVSAGTGLTGGGDLSANRSFAVSYGTTAGTAAQGNDSRLSDARTPLAHTHLVPYAVQADTVANAGTHTTAAGSGSYVDLTLSGATANIAVPTGGANRQTIEYCMYSSGGCTVTFNASVRLGSGITARTVTIGAGQVGRAALKYTTLGALNVWTLDAVSVSST